MTVLRLFTRKVWVALRLIVIGLLVFVVPKFYMVLADQLEPPTKSDGQFRLGIENITPQFLYHFVEGKNGPLKIAYVSNHTAVDQNGRRSLDILVGKGFNVKSIYAPEHGFSGKQLAEKKATNGCDDATGIPIEALYAGNSKIRPFSQKELNDIDAFFFEMQDSGMRHYTYFPTLYKIMEIAAQHNKKVVVFDRPNPLGCVMEGPLVDPGNESFISIASYPVRHGMTVGELALFCNDKMLSKKAQLYIVPMKNYVRNAPIDELLTPLSPNIPDIHAARGYSFLGMCSEISPFRAAVGTPKSFQFIGIDKERNIPMSKWYKLKDKLRKRGVKSKGATVYEPGPKMTCRGLSLDIEDPNKFSGFNTMIEIVDFFRNEPNVSYKMPPIFNKSVGTTEFRKFVEGQLPYDSLQKKINTELQDFYRRAEPYFMYRPYPEITLIGRDN